MFPQSVAGGVVDAALETISFDQEHVSANIRSIVERVRPSVAGLGAGAGPGGTEDVRREAMRANVRASVAQLRHGSMLIERLSPISIGGKLK
jgi:carbonic anhydrase